MTLSVAGAFALGLVWGWLIGALEERVIARGWVTLPWSAATASVGVVVALLGGGWALAAFAGAAGLAWLLHVGWRRELRARFRAGPAGRQPPEVRP